jgi:cytochrome P450
MASTLQQLGVAAAASTLLRAYAPQYSTSLVTTAVLLFFVQVLASLTWTLVLYPRFFSPLRHLPTPPGSFFLGHTRQIINESAGVPMSRWVETLPNDGLVRYLFWGHERVLITQPKGLAEVLVTRNYEFTKPPHFMEGLGKAAKNYYSSRSRHVLIAKPGRVLGIGILLAEGDEHKRQRRNLMPAFSYRHIKEIVPVFWTKSREMVQCLAEAAKANVRQTPEDVRADRSTRTVEHAPGALDVGHWSSRATLDIIGLTGMGQDFYSLRDPNNKLNRTYQTIFRPNRAGRIMNIIGQFLPLWFLTLLPLKRNQEMRDAIGYIKQTCRDLVANKRKVLQEKKEGTGIDIISAALASGGFSDEDLVNQMMTFLAAGHETTATAMIWAIYAICKFPDVQKKLRDEVRSHIPSLDDEVTAAQIDDCHYLQAFCNETLRLWSPVSLTMRWTPADTTVQGQFVPKGTQIVLSPAAINTSTHLWGPDAKEFKPERWLDADGRANNKGSADSNYSFLTFLHGPRSCIGQRFAQAEFACLVAAWVGRFETSFEDPSRWEGELEVKGGITSKPVGGVWVTLKQLDGW